MWERDRAEGIVHRLREQLGSVVLDCPLGPRIPAGLASEPGFVSLKKISFQSNLLRCHAGNCVGNSHNRVNVSITVKLKLSLPRTAFQANFYTKTTLQNLFQKILVYKLLILTSRRWKILSLFFSEKMQYIFLIGRNAD